MCYTFLKSDICSDLDDVSIIMHMYINYGFFCLVCNKHVFCRYSLITTLRLLFGKNNLFENSELRTHFSNTLDLMAHRMGFSSHNYLRLDDSLHRGNVLE